MSISDKLPRGVRRLLRLPPSYARRMRDLDEEIRFHIETHVERLRASGVSESDAISDALKRFGDADDLRAYCGAIAARREPWRRLRQLVDELAQDVHYALRQIRRAPAFTATAAFILALGIGANTGVFSIVHHLLISPLPFADGNRMVMFYSMTGGGRISVTPSNEILEAWGARAHAVEQVLLFEEIAGQLGDSTRGPTEEVSAAALPPSAFDFVGIQPMLGRPILASDTLATAPPVVLLGEGLWRRNFGASRSLIGQSIVLNGASYTVIGITPQTFFIPFAGTRDAFVALHHGGPARLTGLAKLRPGMSIDAANREVAALFPPKSELNTYDEPPKLKRELDLVGHSREQMVLLLFGAVGIVLLIACANVGNLLLARSWSRQREFAVRTALGAGRRRIIRQALTESLMLAFIAGALGIAVAFLVLNGVKAALPAGTDDIRQVTIEGPVFLWSAGVSLLTGLLFGVGPAFAAAGADAGESLKAGGRTASGSLLARRLRTGLVVGEIALSVVLLAGAGLLVRTLVALNHVDLGFRPHGLTSGSLQLTGSAFRDLDARHAALTAALDGVRSIPGVRGAIVSFSAPPRYGIGMGGLEVEGRPIAAHDTLKTMGAASVPPEFFAFAGIQIKQGRTFTPVATISDRFNDDEIIINESLAKRLWPNGNALGARVRRGQGSFGTIVGIVSDVRLPGEQTANLVLNRDLQVYNRQPAAPIFTSLLVRSDLPATVLLPAIAKALHDANPALKLTNIRTADAEVARASAGQRFVLTLIGAFALLAVVLAAVGLHGVIAYSVNQRTREIGVRVALGARASDVTSLVLAQGVRVAAIGVVAGIIGAIAATRALRALLYGVAPGDPITLIAVGIVALVVATLATYAPARRASRLDPIEALRSE